MGRKAGNRRNSGQTLIITALAIALLVLSIVYSVFEAGRRSEMRSAATLNSPVLATKLGLRNTVTSSLVNVSNGGENGILTENLNEYASIIGNQSYFGKCTVLFTALNASPYQSGIWISWGSDGTGVSSAYANFTLVFTRTTADTQMEHAINVTTGLEVEGTYIKLADTNKQVSVTCTVFNEGETALANNITLYYDFDGDLGTSDWTPVTSPSVTDYGNGTYTISCTVDTEIRDDPVLLSAHVYDLRDIFVIANDTCTETGYDYVDNNTSNIDSSDDIGTHSAFAAQQVGPDSTYDTLTEANTSSILTNNTLIDAESFEGSWPPTDWNATGNWNKETDQYYDGSYSADFDGEGNGVSGNLETAELNCSDAVSIFVSFEFYDASLDPNELLLEYFDGTSWVLITDLSNLYTEGTWNLYEQEITDSRYFVSDFKVRWVADDVEGGGGGNDEHAYVDLVTVTKEVYLPDDYKLDLEVQWTDADFDETNEELCIYLGSTSGENLLVEVWTGSSWDSFTTLSVGWNNATVSSYLTSSTFTIRFIGETETDDSTQDYWTIDVTLLHCWS
jgi:hypothetical protein